MIAYASAPLFNVRAITGWLHGTLIPKPDAPGEFAVQLLVDGAFASEVLAVNPEGNYESRPIGTFGGYESCRIVNTNLVFSYTVDEGRVRITHVIPFVEVV